MRQKPNHTAMMVVALMAIVSILLSACTPAATTVAPTPTSPAKKLAVGIVLPTKDEPRWLQDEA
ncbi:MAG: hypothetical protein RMK99_15030, partial [Anaerolineales bacterium]|nr:hypothetical protein [Anaerolineales bacterium]